jgi:GntR family histidine utilization transcriptional repressor
MSSAGDTTLHKKIRADISERILSGDWPPGRRIPFEHELMAQYGCSRMTVNKALSPLAESGLIVRRRRAGSFVSRPRIHSAVLDIPDIQAEISGRGETYGYELLSRMVRPANRGDSEELELGASGPIIALQCLHRAGGRPFALEERLIGLASAPEAEAVDFAAVPPGTWLLGFVPWTEAEHRISAVNVTRATAKLLGIAPTAACLSLERRTWRGDDRITHVRLTFPGDVYDLVARFSPSASRADPVTS